MKKFFLSVLLSLVVFSSSVPFILYPPKAEAILGVGDIVFDPTVFANLVTQLKQLYKEHETLLDSLGIEKDILKNAIPEVLGEYGIGGTSPMLDKLLSGSGLKDLLCDKKAGSGCLGLGGFLGGAFEQILEPQDVFKMILGDKGLDIPTGAIENLQKIGIFETGGFLKEFVAGGEGKCETVDSGTMEKINWVVKKYGLNSDGAKVEELIEGCLINVKQTLNLYQAPAEQTKVEISSPLPPCERWIAGKCLRIASSIPQGRNNSLDLRTDPAGLVLQLFTLILSVSGGIALLLIIQAGYKLMTSSGKPESIQIAREQLIAAMVGLVFILLSYTIFQLIAVDILRIPGISAEKGEFFTGGGF